MVRACSPWYSKIPGFDSKINQGTIGEPKGLSVVGLLMSGTGKLVLGTMSQGCHLCLYGEVRI